MLLERGNISRSGDVFYFFIRNLHFRLGEKIFFSNKKKVLFFRFLPEVFQFSPCNFCFRYIFTNLSPDREIISRLKYEKCLRSVMVCDTRSTQIINCFILEFKNVVPRVFVAFWYQKTGPKKQNFYLQGIKFRGY